MNSVEQLSPQQAVEQVKVLQSKGLFTKAAELCKALLNSVPDSIPVLKLYAELQTQLNDVETALQVRLRLLKLQPNSHEHHSEVASLYYDWGNIEAAERHVRQALALNPLNPQAHNMLGQIMARNYLFEEAVFHYKQVFLLHEPVAAICSNLGNAHLKLGQLKEAEDAFRMGYQLDAQDVALLLSWARMEEARKNFSKAWELIEQAESVDDSDQVLLVIRARLLFREKRFSEALSCLNSVIQHHGFPEKDYEFYFTQGDIFDALGRYDEAMSAYHRGNEVILAVENFLYQEKPQKAVVNGLRNVFRGGAIQKPIHSSIKRWQDAMPTPIFVIGFPRSGTTLIEQIITSHSKVSAGDELSYINRATKLAGHILGNGQSYPQCFENFDTQSEEGGKALDKFRAYYLQNVQSRGILEDGNSLFTDKMPLNELHLGLISLMFPNAPIVHVIRHPMDVVLSCYFNQLTHGGNCSFTLETTAKHYAMIYSLIKHYKQELDLNIHTVCYENLVLNPKENVKSLLDYIGVEWDETCLEFNKNRRYARTASYAQVTEKLYLNSSYRHKNYIQHLGVVKDILEPINLELGYEF